jgi:hypothetical protein
MHWRAPGAQSAQGPHADADDVTTAQSGSPYALLPLCSVDENLLAGSLEPRAQQFVRRWPRRYSHLQRPNRARIR